MTRSQLEHIIRAKVLERLTETEMPDDLRAAVASRSRGLGRDAS